MAIVLDAQNLEILNLFGIIKKQLLKTFKILYLNRLIFLFFIILLFIAYPNQLSTNSKNILATILFVVGLILAIIVLLIPKRLLKQEDPRKCLYRLMGFTLVLISIMAIMRDILRDGYLSKTFNSINFATATQWEVLPLFLILFLGGVGLWLFMLKKYFTVIKEN